MVQQQRRSFALCILSLQILTAFALAPRHGGRPSTVSLQAHSERTSLGQALTTAAVCGALTLGAGSPATAYETSDYASETVQSALEQLKSTRGNTAETFKVYENINAIITEGKGVGGSINYKGVQLDRGYVADEDTSIYNPGLTLLTESEKERLVEGLVQSRKANLAVGEWNEENELGFQFLREKLDPLHMAELRGYLQVMPFLAGAVYLAVLGVQQNVRSLFTVAYFIGAAVVLGPIALLVLAGP